jgi:hypothetical protein
MAPKSKRGTLCLDCAGRASLLGLLTSRDLAECSVSGCELGSPVVAWMPPWLLSSEPGRDMRRQEGRNLPPPLTGGWSQPYTQRYGP